MNGWLGVSNAQFRLVSSLVLCLLSGVVGTAARSAAAQTSRPQLPEPAHPGQGAYKAGELIFSLQARPTPSCHASTIAETPNGLVAAWFGGTREGRSDVSIWSSRQVNGRWTQPVKVADGKQPDGSRFPCWNPVLFQFPNGPLVLFYKVGPSVPKWKGMFMTSEDGGRTWSKPKPLGRASAVGDLIGPVKDKPVLLADGTLLCPSSTEFKGWRVHFELTKDLYRTVKVVGPLEKQKFQAIQPTILQHQDGSLQALCRTREGVIAQTWSKDNGLTWSNLTATSLPNPNAGIDAVTLKDGRFLLVYNHTVRHGPFPSGRNMLNVAVSRDGRAWKPVLTLEKARGEYSYPSVIQTKDGLVHIVYTYRRQSVKHVVLDPRLLR